MDTTKQSNYQTWRRLRPMHDETGSTILETLAVILPAFFYTVIATSLKSILGVKNSKLQCVMEFVLLVIPLILNFTILEPYVMIVLVVSVIVTASLLTLNPKITAKIPPNKKSHVINNKNFITNARSTINLLSVIAILAIDFRIFPRRFYKTENWGVSLMDVGAGLYVFSNGIVAPKVKGRTTSVYATLKSCLPIFFIGAGRFLSVVVVDYYVPVSEYGRHWNFFITLGVVKLLGTITLRFSGFTTVLVIILHEFLLKLHLENYLYNYTNRENFIDANKEGIISSFGYLAIYLLAVQFGRLLNRHENEKKTIKQIIFCALAFFSATIVLNATNGISRKSANAGFCCWILFLGTFMTGLFYLWEEVLTKRMVDYAPEIYKAINYNALVFFLLANVLTGLINMSLDTMAVGPSLGLVIIAVYMAVNCFVVCLLYYKNVAFLKVIGAR